MDLSILNIDLNTISIEQLKVIRSEIDRIIHEMEGREKFERLTTVEVFTQKLLSNSKLSDQDLFDFASYHGHFVDTFESPLLTNWNNSIKNAKSLEDAEQINNSLIRTLTGGNPRTLNYIIFNMNYTPYYRSQSLSDINIFYNWSYPTILMIIIRVDKMHDAEAFRTLIQNAFVLRSNHCSFYMKDNSENTTGIIKFWMNTECYEELYTQVDSTNEAESNFVNIMNDSALSFRCFMWGSSDVEQELDIIGEEFLQISKLYPNIFLKDLNFTLPNGQYPYDFVFEFFFRSDNELSGKLLPKRLIDVDRIIENNSLVISKYFSEKKPKEKRNKKARRKA